VTRLTYRTPILAAFAAAILPIPAIAQPADLPIAPATTTEYPAGVKVLKAKNGSVYTDKGGHTLYGMDLRTLIRWNPDPSKYCQAECAKDWEPLLAPKDAKANIMFPQGFGGNRARPGTPPPSLPAGFTTPQTAPDWAVIDGATGLQWIYKGWNMVYVRKGSKRGSTEFDGAEHMTWNTLKFVPPVPQLVAPSTVSPKFVDSAYALADKDGRLLFSGTCAKDCAGWAPLTAAMASRGIGEWAVGNAGDSPQWLYRGKPVYFSAGDDPLLVPAGASVLRP
jgi:predicted lipoprotein with Yx(FWY)xxD motif